METLHGLERVGVALAGHSTSRSGSEPTNEAASPEQHVTFDRVTRLLDSDLGPSHQAGTEDPASVLLGLPFDRHTDATTLRVVRGVWVSCSGRAQLWISVEQGSRRAAEGGGGRPAYPREPSLRVSGCVVTARARGGKGCRGFRCGR